MLFEGTLFLRRRTRSSLSFLDAPSPLKAFVLKCCLALALLESLLPSRAAAHELVINSKLRDLLRISLEIFFLVCLEHIEFEAVLVGLDGLLLATAHTSGVAFTHPLPVLSNDMLFGETL